MGFAEGWEGGGMLFQTVCFTSGIWFCISRPMHLCKTASERISQPLQGLGGPPQSHSLWTTAFPAPIITRNTFPSVEVPCSHSHPHHQVSKSQPILERLASRGEVDLGQETWV